MGKELLKQCTLNGRIRLCAALLALFLIILVLPVSVVEAAGESKTGKERIRVACVGDSLTYGALASDPAEHSYPARLQTLLGDDYEVQNFGVNGTTMLTGYDLSYVDQEQYTQSLAFDPDIVIIMLGTNDCGRWYWNTEENAGGAKFKQDARALVASYQNLPASPRVIFATSPYCPVYDQGDGGITATQLAPLQRKLAEENNWDLVDMHALTEGKYSLYHDDRMHFTDAGYYYEAECMYEAITGHSFVPEETLPVKSAVSPTSEAGEGIELAIDQDYGTMWHSAYTPAASPRALHYVILELEERSLVDGLYYLPRQGGVTGSARGWNGIITKYEIQVSADGGVNYRTVAKGEWEPNAEWKHAEFEKTEATHIKLVSIESVSNAPGSDFTSALEIKVTGKIFIPVESILFDRESDEMIVKESGQLHVAVTPADADDADKITWESSNEEVLTVDAKGNIKALWPGEASVTAKAGDKSDSIKVTVYGVEKIYTDVRNGDWFYDAANWAYVNDVMSGYGNGTFGPSDTLARAQFAQILYRTAGGPKAEFKNKFPDVAENDWFADAVIWANDNEIITGYTATGTFGPADNITREQIAAILYRYAKAEGYDVKAADDLSDFPDAEKVSGYAEAAVKWAVAKGLIKGDNGNLNPQGSTKRAEAAIIIQRFHEAYGE